MANYFENDNKLSWNLCTCMGERNFLLKHVIEENTEREDKEEEVSSY